jgi:hypothetical protein
MRTETMLRVKTAGEAIESAKLFLARKLGKVPPSHITAEHRTNTDIEGEREELAAFCRQEGLTDDNEINGLTGRLTLEDDHWVIHFWPPSEPDRASTLPPTVVRVYDSDGRTELVLL